MGEGGLYREGEGAWSLKKKGGDVEGWEGEGVTGRSIIKIYSDGRTKGVPPYCIANTHILIYRHMYKGRLHCRVH